MNDSADKVRIRCDYLQHLDAFNPNIFPSVVEIRQLLLSDSRIIKAISVDLQNSRCYAFDVFADLWVELCPKVVRGGLEKKWRIWFNM